MEGEGSSQGSETESGHVEVKEVRRAMQAVKRKGTMQGVMRQWQRCSDLSRIVDVACRYMRSGPRHPAALGGAWFGHDCVEEGDAAGAV